MGGSSGWPSGPSQAAGDCRDAGDDRDSRYEKGQGVEQVVDVDGPAAMGRPDEDIPLTSELDVWRRTFGRQRAESHVMADTWPGSGAGPCSLRLRFRRLPAGGSGGHLLDYADDPPPSQSDVQGEKGKGQPRGQRVHRPPETATGNMDTQRGQGHAGSDARSPSASPPLGRRRRSRAVISEQSQRSVVPSRADCQNASLHELAEASSLDAMRTGDVQFAGRCMKVMGGHVPDRASPVTLNPCRP
jgi:hypothetical protein